MKVEHNYVYEAQVVSWYDGDTMTANVDLGFGIKMSKKKIRLFGIDTPEMRGPEKAQGTISRDAVRKWLPIGTDFLLRSHLDKSGKYGRLICDVFPMGWGESINERLLNEGLAKVYGS